jgi:bifunctional UDP-N-acetylglucosamine pyrophosphorylase/glucosamine-1-phosphate N-acetyltransferase
VHEQKDVSSTILTTDLPNPTGYGRIIRNTDHSLMKIIEEKDASEEERKSTEINSGIYVFDAQILFRLLPLVGNNNKQNEYYLPDVLNLIIQEKGKVAIDKINNYIEIQGVNNTKQLIEVNELYENA